MSDQKKTESNNQGRSPGTVLFRDSVEGAASMKPVVGTASGAKPVEKK